MPENVFILCFFQPLYSTLKALLVIAIHNRLGRLKHNIYLIQNQILCAQRLFQNAFVTKMFKREKCYV